jgi:hypothetical protein
MSPIDPKVETKRMPWVKPAVQTDKAVHAEGSHPRTAVHDAATCNS